MSHQKEATSVLFDRWIGKANENIEEWGLQDEDTLLLAIQEELGELTQAHLEARAEGGDPERIDEELDDLGALLIQLHETRQSDSGDMSEENDA
jgi:NTP pyrophosphatase (non-canonical NTP hydrolase)